MPTLFWSFPLLRVEPNFFLRFPTDRSKAFQFFLSSQPALVVVLCVKPHWDPRPFLSWQACEVLTKPLGAVRVESPLFSYFPDFFF